MKNVKHSEYFGNLAELAINYMSLFTKICKARNDEKGLDYLLRCYLGFVVSLLVVLPKKDRKYFMEQMYDVANDMEDKYGGIIK